MNTLFGTAVARYIVHIAPVIALPYVTPLVRADHPVKPAPEVVDEVCAVLERHIQRLRELFA